MNGAIEVIGYLTLRPATKAGRPVQGILRHSRIQTRLEIYLGEIDKALAALRQAERLEPLSPAIACDFGFLFYWAR